MEDACAVLAPRRIRRPLTKEAISAIEAANDQNECEHTQQWCKRRMEYQKLCEEYEIERMLKEDADLKARYEHVQTEREPYDATKTAQARCFDELRMPFTVRPDIGAVVGVVGEPHHGKWTFDASGGVVARLTHS